MVMCGAAIDTQNALQQTHEQSVELDIRALHIMNLAMVVGGNNKILWSGCNNKILWSRSGSQVPL